MHLLEGHNEVRYEVEGDLPPTACEWRRGRCCTQRTWDEGEWRR